jgi:hypothetical protein
LAGLLLLVLSLFLFLQTPYAQKKLLKIVTNTFSQKIHSTFTIGSLNIDFFNRVRLNKVYIQDLHGDTLLYANSITAVIAPSMLFHKKVELKRIMLNKADVRFSTDAKHVFNLQFIIDAFTSKSADTTSTSKWQVQFKKVILSDSKFRYSKYPIEKKGLGINFTDLNIVYLNLTTSDFQFRHDTVMFNIERLTAVEHSGFFLKKLSAKFSLSRHFMKYDDVHFVTANSEVDAPRVDFLFKSFALFSENFLKNVSLLGEIKPSKVNVADIAYFAPALWGLHHTVNFSGRVTGPVAEMRCKDIKASIGEVTHVEGNFDLTGLPNIFETFIFADFKRLSVNVSDLETFHEGFRKRPVTFPDILNKFGTVNYKGNFSGFITDFVAYGHFTTALGNLSSDVSLKPGTDKTLQFKGRIITDGFNVGVIAGAADKLGKVSMSADAEGFFKKGKLTATLQAAISNLQANGYNYTNIKANGNFDDKQFEGSVEVNDPNLKLDFKGDVDFDKQLPEFHFVSDINANLYPLKLTKADTTLTLQSKVKANFKGKNFDEIVGNIQISDLFVRHKNHEAKIGNISLSATNENNTRQLRLRSDPVNADLTGEYTFSQLGTEWNRVLNRYIPSMTDNQKLWVVTAKVPQYMQRSPKVSLQAPAESGNIELDAIFNNTDSIFGFFAPSMKMARQSHIKGTYNGHSGQLSLTGDLPYLKISENLFRKINIDSYGDASKFNLNIISNCLVVGYDTVINQLTIKNQLRRDTGKWNVRWMEPTDSSKISNVNAYTFFSHEGNNYITKIAIEPGNVLFNDSIWSIERSKVIIDTSGIDFRNMAFRRTNQSISLFGKISANPNDTLHFIFNNLNIRFLSMFVKNKDINFDGKLFGNARLNNLYTKPAFQCDMKVQDFKFNKEALGDAYIISQWDEISKQLAISSYIQRGNLKTISLKGFYYPPTHNLSFITHFEKTKLNVLNPFVKGIFSNISGVATGDASIEGTLNQPRINGNLKLQKNSFKVDYLNTTYDFTGNLVIQDNTFILPKTKIYDSFGNSSDVSLTVANNYLKDFQLDVQIEPNNFACLNTTEENNAQFYGSAFATGKVHIYGPVNQLTMDIFAKTDKKTKIYIPLNHQSEAKSNDFVTFITKQQSSVVDDPLANSHQSKYSVNTNGLMLNFTLEVTPDAELQLIFDKKVGDIIRGRGNGNISMEINTAGNFHMYGNYKIKEGEYLFTLKNVINKRLTIEENGSIQWTGNPTDADLDLTAVYKVKTSLADYLGSSSTGEYSRRMPIDCKLQMQGKLSSPAIHYSIELPSADEETKTRLRTALSNEGELNKQFLSLLIFNTFYSNNERMAATGSSAGLGSSASMALPSEFLSNQLSNWLSQATDKFDVGVNYRPGDELTTQQLEVALSTHLFDDRVTISTNIGQAGQSTTTTTNKQANDIVGDFLLDYKVTESGKLHLKAFNRSNDQLLYEQTPYTQGFGVFYKEEFNNFGDLFRRKKKAKNDTIKTQDKTPVSESLEKPEDKSKQPVNNDSIPPPKAIIPATDESKTERK